MNYVKFCVFNCLVDGTSAIVTVVVAIVVAIIAVAAAIAATIVVVVAVAVKLDFATTSAKAYEYARGQPKLSV